VQCMRENMLESYKQGNEWWHLFKKRAQHERVCVNWFCHLEELNIVQNIFFRVASPT
jgi:hypothetical protein